MVDTIETDVLVVGAGGAGMRTALEAHRAGARVVVAVKGRFGAIGTRGAGATAAGFSEIGLMRLIGYDDAWSGEWDGAQTRQGQVFGDILQAGLGMADREIARVVVEEAAAARHDLDEWGMVPTFAHGYGVKTHGVPIKIVLESLVRRSTVDVRERLAVVRVLTSPAGEVAGAVAVDEKSGKVVHIRCSSVIIAAGGMGRLFTHSFHPSCVTGDAYALALHAGAELMNMEFHQIFVGTTSPNTNLVGSWLWRHQPQLTNVDGEEFVHRYLPSGRTVEEAQDERRRHTPFSTRDEISRYIDVAMHREIRAGRGTASGGVHVDVVVTDEKNGPFSDVGEWYRYRGVHWDRGSVDVGLFHHCSNGGVRVDVNGESRVPGLFAIGEAAAGAHGADRLGGMMLVSSQVFGIRAGRLAAKRRGSPPAADLAPLDEIVSVVDRLRSGTVAPGPAMAGLARVMWEELLVERTPAGLKRVLQTLDEIEADALPKLGASDPLQAVRALELRNATATARAVGLAALTRTESRGGHYRVDHEFRDDASWLDALLVGFEDDTMTVQRLRVDPEWKPRRADMWGTKWG
ncbi:FAD-binding protein [Jiangella asiatica]|uniref:FAD-binding protein n=1 Tax=Jiangella asiatica TaxID=2530372 RepID=A0A4R5CPB7_9ACTN|nr:FAD-binding protein [Jiangella asiatica]TDE01150.1 FAD-binding protein [Jiangella asiatica]